MMSILLVAVTVVLGIIGAGLAILITLGGANSRAEEEYWAAYWLDTPSTDSTANVIVARIPHLAGDSEGEARHAA
ncbi:MAG TPA: hypothetical protein VGK34_07165 [Armatimonadota bacterium]|jgi:hypothetical protein